MSSWSKRRKALYSIVITIIAVGAIIVPGFLLIYQAPSCFDGKRNGNEQGIDCGGSCQKLCQSAFLSPSVAWTRFEQVAPELYNVAAYIVNPNNSGEAINVPYHFVLFDTDGTMITKKDGFVTLPPHRNTLAFAGAVDIGKRIPSKALFEFISPPNWRLKEDPLQALSIVDKKYFEEKNNSSLTVTFKNNGLQTIGRTSVYVVLYDQDNNALGFSKTVIDSIDPKSIAIAPFTWPVSRDGKVISIEVLPVAE